MATDLIVKHATELARKLAEDVDDVRRLPDGVRQVFLVGDIEFDVACDGIDAWLERHAETARAMLEALGEIGALRTADVIVRLFAVFPRGQPSTNRDALEDQIAALGDDVRDGLFAELADEILASLEEIDDLLRPYVLKHAAAFQLGDLSRN